MDKPRIMIVSDSPVLPTGMGVAHQELAARLHNTGKYHVTSVGWFHPDNIEWKAPWEMIVLSDRMYGHPQNWPDSTAEQLALCSMNKAIVKARPDIVITLADTWMCDYFAKLPTRKTFKWMWEFPIDGEPVPKSWVRLVKNADLPIVMTKYGERVLRDVDPNIQLTRIPRGIMESFYRMPHSKNILKKEASPLFENRFLIGCVARFQDRKQLSRGVEAVHKFIKKYNRKDALLYLHCDLNDPASRSLYKTLVGEDGIIERYGMEDYVSYDKRITVEHGVSPERMNLLYNAFDIQIMPTQGEGWGLPLVECMAAGTPCIATNYTSIPELLKGHGQLANVATYITGMYNVERALVDTDHMADLINYYYSNPAARERDGVEASRFARTFAWDTIIRVWQMHIDKLLYQKTYGLMTTADPTPIDTNKYNICGAVAENTGWAITTRGMAHGLTEIGKDVSITEGGGHIPGYQLSDATKALVAKGRNSDIDIINHLPQNQKDFLMQSNARIKLSYFPWELTRLNGDWVYALNRFCDAYMCPSSFIKQIATENGVNNVYVVPLGTDDTIDPKAEPVKVSEKGYHFLYIGQLGDPRKNVEYIIKAYLETFTGDDDVALVLKSNPGHKNSDPTEISEFLSLGKKNPARIVVIHNEVGNENLSRLYAACDCLVHVAHAEGWGQPILEALKFGMPVIAPLYGGFIDFAGNNIIPVKHRMVDAKKSLSYVGGARWCDPDFPDLCARMREVFDHKIKKIGKNLVPNYTWEHTARAIAAVVDDVKVQEPKIKVYFETGMHSLWNQDNEYNLKKYAPRDIEFTADYSRADVQILNVTRLSDSLLINNKKYVALFHTYGEWAEEPHNKYDPIFQSAMMVYSHLDLSSEHKNINFLRGPWGVDTSKYREYGHQGVKPFNILCTGSVPQTEGISETVAACSRANLQMVHLGPKLFDEKGYYCAGHVDHDKLVDLYNSSMYISGMRRIEGFEKTVAEGILCGVRPICFDNPIYKYWYGSLVEYIKEGTFDETSQDIEKVLTGTYRLVTDAEKQRVMMKFGWIPVARAFWAKFLETYRGPKNGSGSNRK